MLCSSSRVLTNPAKIAKLHSSSPQVEWNTFHHNSTILLEWLFSLHRHLTQGQQPTQFMGRSQMCRLCLRSPKPTGHAFNTVQCSAEWTGLAAGSSPAWSLEFNLTCLEVSRALCTKKTHTWNHFWDVSSLGICGNIMEDWWGGL